MASISTHVLDLATGRPASGIQVTLESLDHSGWGESGVAETNEDGRVSGFGSATLASGVYRLVFSTRAYHQAFGRDAFHPRITIEFQVTYGEHHHVPLLLSPFGYSTYRGS